MFLTHLAIGSILFMLGAAVGSFLNVVISRSLTKESWIWGRSHCDDCQKQISWYDNIPVLSYLILKAKCRHCRKPIALTHPVVEFLVGSLFVWWYISISFIFTLTQHPFVILQPLFWLTVGMVLIAIFVYDMLYSQILVLPVAFLMILTVIYRLALVSFGIMQLQDLAIAGLGMILSMSFIWGIRKTAWLIYKKEAMGDGDVILMAPLSLLMGWPNVLVGLYLSFVLGGIAGMVLILGKKKELKSTIPFGPFLILGTFISLVWGDNLINWYLSLL